ncbi:MAG: methyl-accepting chemotaxis protein [Rubrimonas sp.]
MLNSLSVRARLFAGFGLVLVMMSGLAGFSVMAVSGIGSVFGGFRSEARLAAALNDIYKDMAKTRLSDLAYRSNADPAVAEEVLRHVENMRTDVRRVAGVATDAARQAEIRAVSDALEAYAADFAAFNEATVAREALVAEAGRLGIEHRRNIGKLHGLLDERGVESLAYRALRASELFLVTRVRVDRFFGGMPESEFDTASKPLADTLSALESLPMALLTTEEREIARTSIEGVQTFRSVIDAARDAELLRRQRIAALDIVAEDFVEAAVAADDSAMAAQDALGVETEGRIAASMTTTMAVAGAAVVVGLALATLIGRWIGGAIGAMAGSMRQLADGDLRVSVNGAEYEHELGQMARALQRFKENAQRVQNLEAEQAAARTAAMRELASAFGTAVEAASRGDFSTRVQARFDDESLNALVEGLNRMMADVSAAMTETTRVMGRVAEGDLSHRMNGRFEGVFAALQQDVNATVERLAELVSAIAVVSDEIAAASEEIASGATQVSSRAEQQAAAVEETSATMTEMASSISSSAESAQRAAALVRENAARADGGRSVADAAQDAMRRIEQSSERITDIVAIIDSIAFTTNLLALNASVEAARAGEVGRGFAVVAAEVRTLAGRTAESAKEIRALIDESAVHVKDGVQQVGETQTALNAIARGASDVTSAIDEVSMAAREQASGASEITSAINQIDQLTQANAALAEESASSAAGLAEQTAKLKGLVSSFRGVDRRGGYSMAVAAE